MRLEVHNPADRKRLAYLATTQAGRRIYLNRTAVEADQLVVLAGMQFDPMHGYGGAAALVYPALGDTETRHAWEKALTNEPPADEAWPVRREAEEVLWLLGAPFLIQVIPGRDDEIAQVIAGASDSAASSRALDARWRATAPRKADSGHRRHQRRSGNAVDGVLGPCRRVGRPRGRAGRHDRADDRCSTDGRRWTRPCEGIRRARRRVAELHARPSADYPAAYQWLRAVGQGRVVLWSGLSDDESEALFATRLESPRQLQKLIDAASSCLILPDAHHLLAVPTNEE